MSDKTTSIRITKGGDSGSLFVSVNGKPMSLPADGKPVDVTDEILGALENSNAEFEKVGAALSDAPAGGGDGSGEQPSPSPLPDESAPEPINKDVVEDEPEADPEPVPAPASETEPEPTNHDVVGAEPVPAALTEDDLAVLDRSVPDVVEAVKDWPAGKLGLLVAAENAGKTRSTLIAAIETLPQTAAPEA